MKTEHGLAYVMLGRTEKLDDIYIAGELDFDGISCSKIALGESLRLAKIFNEAKNDEAKDADGGLKISYLNIQSLRDKIPHIMNSSCLMESHIMAFGETWLGSEESIMINGHQGIFASCGRGKGVAVYAQINPVCEPVASSNDSLSFVVFTHEDFLAVFLYRSQSCKESQLCSVFEEILVDKTPIVIMGDVNIDSEKKSELYRFMTARGFSQEITKPTCDTGSTLDHIYVNKEMKALIFKVNQNSVYFSDHDVITLQMKNCSAPMDVIMMPNGT